MFLPKLNWHPLFIEKFGRGAFRIFVVYLIRNFLRKLAIPEPNNLSAKRTFNAI